MTTTRLSLMATQVLTDADLLRRITAFQCGLAWPLFDFWRTHKPESVPLRLDRKRAATLVQLLAAHGTRELLELAKKATFVNCRRKEFTVERGSLMSVAEDALRANRADILDWALATNSSELHSSIWEIGLVVLRNFTDDHGPRMLDVLKKYMLLSTLPTRPKSRMSLLKWLVHEIQDVEIPANLIEHAAGRGDIEMLRFLHEHGLRMPNLFISCDEIHSRRLEVLTFLLENYAEDLDPTGAVSIALSRDPQIRQLAYRFAECLQVACVDYIDNSIGDMWLTEVKDWVSRGVLSSRWPISIDSIAGNDKLGIIRFLHEQGIATATTEAMDLAAANGHLWVVQYLHENRTEGCTVAAILMALQNSHFPVVYFLFDKYRELFEVRLALTRVNQLGEAQSLHRQVPHVSMTRVLPGLLLYGAFDIYRTLQSQYPEDADAVISSALYEAGRTMNLRVIRFIVDELDRRDLAHRAMDGAASTSTSERHWLHAVYSVTGPGSCRLSAVLSAVEHLIATVPLSPPSLELISLKYVIRKCAQPDAKQVAIEAVEAHHRHGRTFDMGFRRSRNLRYVELAILVIAELTKWDPATEDSKRIPIDQVARTSKSRLGEVHSQAHA